MAAPGGQAVIIPTVVDGVDRHSHGSEAGEIVVIHVDVTDIRVRRMVQALVRIYSVPPSAVVVVQYQYLIITDWAAEHLLAGIQSLLWRRCVVAIRKVLPVVLAELVDPVLVCDLPTAVAYGNLIKLRISRKRRTNIQIFIEEKET